MGRYKSAAQQRVEQQKKSAILKFALVGIAIAALGIVYFAVSRNVRELDKVTLCTATPETLTTLLVDVTDPMNLAQRQDFNNQLERLRNSIPRYGKLSVVKVDATSDKLLAPVIARCSPGTAADVDDLTGNPAAVAKKWEEGFKQPLDAAFKQLLEASGATRSPILESIQSVALTDLQAPQAEGKGKRLIIVSDLLQNTDAISFYGQLPEPSFFVESPAFRAVRTDLRGIKVELWMLQRTDSKQSQPRALPDLWDAIISAQGGTLERVYTVSG